MLAISLMIFPSFLHPSNPAKELVMIKTILYSPIDIMVGKTNKINATTSAIPTFERKYSMLAPAVLSDSPIVFPTRGII